MSQVICCLKLLIDLLTEALEELEARDVECAKISVQGALRMAKLLQDKARKEMEAKA